jgi:hypothetical protein
MKASSITCDVRELCKKLELKEVKNEYVKGYQNGNQPKFGC